jgi:wyosine [tRNA(Phe)-imidazoG37] synthetase (radical SAM superfamily)
MTQHCPNPFEWLDITAWHGDKVKFSLCIQSWSGPATTLAVVPWDEAPNVDIEQLWNGDKARAIRSEALTGHAAFCDGCPKWDTGDWPVIDGEATRERSLTSPGPTMLNIAYDRSCNLRCPSCRTDDIVHTPGSKRHDQIADFQDRVVRPLLKHAKRAQFAGDGDPFGSPIYRDMLMTLQPKDVPDLKWFILTNGQGFTPRRYEAIPTREQIDRVQFSIDAATPETYQQNRDSDWGLLMRNLGFAGGLRADGPIEQLDISMVVQSNNYRETRNFVDLAAQNNVDNVQFSCLLPQGLCIGEEYKRRAVHVHSHAEHAAAMEAITEALAYGQEVGVRVKVELPRWQKAVKWENAR